MADLNTEIGQEDRFVCLRLKWTNQESLKEGSTTGGYFKTGWLP